METRLRRRLDYGGDQIIYSGDQITAEIRPCVPLLKRDFVTTKMSVMMKISIFVFTRPETDSHMRLLEERQVRVKNVRDDTNIDICIHTT